MQLIIKHSTEPELVLPINYQHILQAIIYKGIECLPEYAKQVHDYGYQNEKRSYKLFQFSQLKGKYQIEQRKIIFFENVSFEVRSVDAQLILTLKKYFEENGICYGERRIENVEVKLEDKTVEKDDILIKMKTPVTVHSTDCFTKRTFFFRPNDERFAELVNENFKRKYKAHKGVLPEENIDVEIIHLSEKDKFVTNYKGFYISGWYGIYRLKGNRKYLDFLYQTGIGDRNSQGFGMFDLKDMEG
mgnify:CR=1 FL=1